jgi:hypothetical protein
MSLRINSYMVNAFEIAYQIKLKEILRNGWIKS